MDIDGDVWGKRFFMGVLAFVAIVILLPLVGTKTGRTFLLLIVVVVALIFGLGYSVDVLHQGYKEYME